MAEAAAMRPKSYTSWLRETAAIVEPAGVQRVESTVRPGVPPVRGMSTSSRVKKTALELLFVDTKACALAPICGSQRAARDTGICSARLELGERAPDLRLVRACEREGVVEGERGNGFAGVRRRVRAGGRYEKEQRRQQGTAAQA